MKRKIGRPGNEEEVKVEKLEVGHVEESPARGKHELWEKKITVNKRKSKQQTKLTKLMKKLTTESDSNDVTLFNSFHFRSAAVR